MENFVSQETQWAVRVQDDAYGMRSIDGGVSLFRPVDWRPNAEFDIRIQNENQKKAAQMASGYSFPRDTFHFAVNGIVSNHSMGEFNGGLVICSPMDKMASTGSVAQGCHQDDTWWHADKGGRLDMPGAKILAPTSMALPPELDAIAVRYDAPSQSADPEGFDRARRAAVNDFLQSQGVKPATIGTAAVHFGSLAHQMEGSLNLFQAQFHDAIQRGPEGWAKEEIKAAATNPGLQRSWMTLPKGQDAAREAEKAMKNDMIEALEKMEAKIMRASDTLVSPEARERFSERVKICRSAIFDNTIEIGRQTALWADRLEASSSMELLGPKPPQMSEDAYWNWAQERASSMEAAGPEFESPWKIAGARNVIASGMLPQDSTVVAQSMDGEFRAMPASRAFEASMRHGTPPPLPPALESLNMSDRLGQRRAASPSFPPPSAPRQSSLALS